MIDRWMPLIRVKDHLILEIFEEKIDEMVKAKQDLTNLTVATGENWVTELSN